MSGDREPLAMPSSSGVHISVWHPLSVSGTLSQPIPDILYFSPHLQFWAQFFSMHVRFVVNECNFRNMFQESPGFPILVNSFKF